jgi:uncharacterized protein
MTAILVLAKAPIAGRSKTRLCPPLDLEEAAAVAEASLVTTLDAVSSARATRRVLVLEGEPGPWLPASIDVIPQRGSGHAARLASAFADAGAPAVLIGMDSPQVTATMLDQAIDMLAGVGTDAVLGPAVDGGWWAIGLHRVDGRVFAGVPMSRADTGRRQLDRLECLGLRTRLLPRLRDVDHYADAVAVAAMAPETPFAETVGRLADAEPAAVR